jgi:hypothetical protein
MEGAMGGFPGNGSLRGPVDCPPTANRAVSVYEEHAAAVQEWHESCHDFARAEARKAKAHQTLMQVNERLGKSISLMSSDPTNKAEAAQSRY